MRLCSSTEKEKQFFRENFGRPPKVVRKKKKKKREELKVTKAPIGKALVKSKNVSLSRKYSGLLTRGHSRLRERL